MRTRYYPIAALVVIALILSCAKPTPQHSFLDFFIGAVEVLVGTGAPRPAEIKMPLFPEDTVKTGDKSMAFLQCGADNIIQVLEKSEFRLSRLPTRMDSARASTALRLLRGKATFFSEPLGDGGSFEVKLSSVTCAVRGTLFSAGLSGETAVIAVKEGSVTLTSDDGKFSEFSLDAGKKAEISGSSVKVTPMNAADAGLFREIEKVRPMAGINCTPPEYIERYFRWRLDIVVPAVPKDGKSTASDDTTGKTSPTGPDEKAAPAAGTRLLVNPLAANGVDDSEASEISQKVLAALRAARGADKVVSRTGADWRSANRILSGRVSKLGATRIISVSIANTGTGAVLYSKTLTMREGEDLDAGINNVAREIGTRTEVWE